MARREPVLTGLHDELTGLFGGQPLDVEQVIDGGDAVTRLPDARARIHPHQALAQGRHLVGGGARYAIGEHVEVAAHAGFTQPNDPFYRQATQAPARMGIATTTVFTLDRPRLVVACRPLT